MSIFIFRSAFVYSLCAERTLIRIKQVCCVTEFHFGKGLFCKQTPALAVLLKRKYCLRFVYGRKFYLHLPEFYLGFIVWGRSPEWPKATRFIWVSGGMLPRKFFEMNMR